MPFFHVKKQKFWRAKSYYGNLPFRYDGKGRGLFLSYILAIILHIPTFGLIWLWYLGKRHRYDFAHTYIGKLNFKSTVTGWSLFVLYFFNILILLFTLGLGLPWVIVRTLNFKSKHITLSGSIDLNNVLQEAKEARAMGEGFTDALDIDFGIF
jgi:uncharacterized membrane protein YjgN (DUF898 family)